MTLLLPSFFAMILIYVGWSNPERVNFILAIKSHIYDMFLQLKQFGWSSQALRPGLAFENRL